MLRNRCLRRSRPWLASRTVAAAPRRLDPQSIARLEVAGRLRRQLAPVQQVAPARTVRTARAPARSVPAALGDQREPHRRERLELAHEAVAAAPRAGAAAVPPDGQFAHSEGKLGLERL